MQLLIDVCLVISKNGTNISDLYPITVDKTPDICIIERKLSANHELWHGFEEYD